MVLSGAALLVFAAVTSASAAPSLTTVPNGLAGYYTPDGSVGASVTVIVPAISCRGVAAGTVAGQSYGIFVWDNQNTEAAFSSPPTYNATVDVRAYCEGVHPVYDTEFVIPQSPGTVLFQSAGVAVRPGNVVLMSVSVSSSRTSLAITNASTRRHASATGPLGSLDAGPNIGLNGISANSSGGILSSGLEGDTTPGLPGPVAATPAAFLDATISGRPLLSAPGLEAETWDSASATLARPTPIIPIGLGGHSRDSFGTVVVTPAP